jgi:hypothetical protein
LKPNLDKSLLHPAWKRFTTEECVDRKGATLNFSALHCQVLLSAAGVTADDLEFESEGFLEQSWDVVA